MENFRSRAQVGMVLQSGLDPLLIANQQKLEPIVAPARKRGAFDHHANAFITAHRIDGDTRQAHRANPPLTGLRARRR